MAYLFDEKAPFEAGKGWGYSDTNYIVLGRSVEFWWKDGSAYGEVKVVIAVGTASPPDVRRGYAPPAPLRLSKGLCPWSGLGPRSVGQNPNAAKVPAKLPGITCGQVE